MHLGYNIIHVKRTVVYIFFSNPTKLNTKTNI